MWKDRGYGKTRQRDTPRLDKGVQRKRPLDDDDNVPRSEVGWLKRRREGVTAAMEALGLRGSSVKVSAQPHAIHGKLKAHLIIAPACLGVSACAMFGVWLRWLSRNCRGGRVAVLMVARLNRAVLMAIGRKSIGKKPCSKRPSAPTG